MVEMKKYILYTIKHLPLWLAISLLSLIAMYISASFTNPPVILKPRTVEDAVHVVNVSNTVREIKLNASTRSIGYFENIALHIQTALLIFTHNLIMVLLYAIPLTGVLIYGLSIIYNSWVLNELRVIIGFGMSLEDFIVKNIVLKPHTYLELLSYSIAVCESTLLWFRLFIKKDRQALHYYIYSVILSVLILLISSIVETILI